MPPIQATYETIRKAHEAHSRDQRKNLNQMKGQLQELVDELDKDSHTAENSRQQSAPPEYSTPQKTMTANATALNSSPRAQVIGKYSYIYPPDYFDYFVLLAFSG